MQLSNDLIGFQLLHKTVNIYYQERGRASTIFSDRAPGEEGCYFVRFLVDRRHVIEYQIGEDRGFLLGALLLAIGPHYFGPSDFWSYENGQRFSIEATTEAIRKNLELLDEFLEPNKGIRK